VTNEPSENAGGSLGQAWNVNVPADLPRLGDSIPNGRQPNVGNY
jgi:hypothetical protein